MSFVELDGVGWIVRPSTDASSGWSVDIGDSRTLDLDEWLMREGVSTTDERMPVLAYGSNARPGKIEWLREERSLVGPVVALEADVQDAAAVWSAGVRARDGERPAVLAAAPGTSEHHAVWLATPEQRTILDQTEGRGERYRLAWVHAPATLTNGTRLDWVLAYLARPEVIGQDVEQ